jgi:5-carboxymethyl-2-hydroxymuconate isomerase
MHDCEEDMPHITIEYSANIADHHDVDALMAAIHAAALAHGLPPADGLRTRATQRDHYLVADGSADLAFVAIAIRIGPGRDSDSKTSFIEAVLNAAEAQLDGEDGPLAVAWSIELNEIDPEFRINRNHVRTRLAQRSTIAEEAPSHG